MMTEVLCYNFLHKGSGGPQRPCGNKPRPGPVRNQLNENHAKGSLDDHAAGVTLVSTAIRRRPNAFNLLHQCQLLLSTGMPDSKALGASTVT